MACHNSYAKTIYTIRIKTKRPTHSHVIKLKTPYRFRRSLKLVLPKYETTNVNTTHKYKFAYLYKIQLLEKLY